MVDREEGIGLTEFAACAGPSSVICFANATFSRGEKAKRKVF